MDERTGEVGNIKMVMNSFVKIIKTSESSSRAVAV